MPAERAPEQPDPQSGPGVAASPSLGDGFKQVVRAPVYMQVAEQLREAIFDGRLGAGEALPTERELAESFGISRASVREALRALQAQGLLRGGGAGASAVVADDLERSARDVLTTLLRLKQVEVSDLVDLRCLLEMAAAERAAHRRDHARLAEAREAVEAMDDGAMGIEEFDGADVRFHVALVRASGNEAMHLVMLSLREPVAAHLLGALRTQSEPHKTLRRLAAEHAAILEAVEAGEGERAAILIERHIRGFYGSAAR